MERCILGTRPLYDRWRNMQRLELEEEEKEEEEEKGKETGR